MMRHTAALMQAESGRCVVATLLPTLCTLASLYMWQLAEPGGEQPWVHTHLAPASPRQCSTGRVACSAFMLSVLEQLPLCKAGCAQLHGVRLACSDLIP